MAHGHDSDTTAAAVIARIESELAATLDKYDPLAVELAHVRAGDSVSVHWYREPRGFECGCCRQRFDGYALAHDVTGYPRACCTACVGEVIARVIVQVAS